MIVKALLVWLFIALAETIHGILRVKLLNPRVGDKRSRQLAVITGSLIILLIGWISVAWINPRSNADSLLVGGIWLGLMLAFDFALGRLFMRASWERLLADFDIGKGGYLAFGMTTLFLTPLLIAGLLQLY
jgi:hypothetical protein